MARAVLNIRDEAHLGKRYFLWRKHYLPPDLTQSRKMATYRRSPFVAEFLLRCGSFANRTARERRAYLTGSTVESLLTDSFSPSTLAVSTQLFPSRCEL